MLKLACPVITKLIIHCRLMLKNAIKSSSLKLNVLELTGHVEFPTGPLLNILLIIPPG
jgi:hypothetical protein